MKKFAGFFFFLSLSLFKTYIQFLGYYFGAKLVRGAYMVLERRRALEKNYPSPICETIEETHANYNLCIEKVK